MTGIKVSNGKEYAVIAGDCGYGKKSYEQLSLPGVEWNKKKTRESSPAWFKKGMEAALLAPTAMNQQKFYFELRNDKVSAKPGLGFNTKSDLGIAECNFEIGSDKDSSIWEK